VPIVTFTTDFGFRDGYAGAMKGVVLSMAPDAKLVDITHGVPARDVMAGAVALASAAAFFPPGTIHVAVVDPGVGAARAGLIVEAGGSLFVGPDNGLLSLAARPPRRIFAIESPSFRREVVSPTFHGRDVFAPAAARLATGARADEAGPARETMVDLAALSSAGPARPGVVTIEGKVIHVDVFGNLITSVPAQALSAEPAVVEVHGKEGVFHPAFGRTFSDVEPGALVAYVGSGGQLEIARRDGSAAERVGAERGSIVRVRSGA
jgi:S-adenosylmethionine hydrolase